MKKDICVCGKCQDCREEEKAERVEHLRLKREKMADRAKRLRGGEVKDLRTDPRALLSAVEAMHDEQERRYLDERDEERRERERGDEPDR